MVTRSIDGKINNCWKRLQTTWTQRLMNDSSFTDPIPSTQAEFVTLVTDRSDYKNRKKRDDEHFCDLELLKVNRVSKYH